MAVDWEKSAREMADRVDAINADVSRQASSLSSDPRSSSNSDSSSDRGNEAPANLGSLYSKVQGTDWWSTHPDNPNATKYDSQGRPVASIGFDFTNTGGPKFDGYGSGDQFNNIRNLAQSNDQAGLSKYLTDQYAGGKLTSNDSIYKNGLAADPRSSLLSTASYSPTVKTDTLTPTGSPQRWNVDAPYQDRLARFKSNPADAQNEILALKQMYDGATGNVARQAEIGGWADQVRQAAGISDSNALYGNNNGVDPNIQRQTTAGLLNDPRFLNPGTGTGTTGIGGIGGTGGTGGTGVGTGIGGTGVGSTGGGNAAGTGVANGQSLSDLINSIYDKNYASQAQKLKESRDLMLAGLAGKEGVIDQNTIKNLNSNDVMATQRMQALKEAMANAGLSASGDNVSAQVGLGNSQQQGATDINNNKTNQLADLVAQRNAINNNASASDLALMQQLQATRDGQLVNQGNTDRTFNYNAGRDLVKDSQWDKSFGLQKTGQDFNQNMSTQEFADRQKQQRITLANSLSQAYGITVDPKEDTSLMYAQVQGKTPINMQQLDIAKQNANSMEQERQAMAKYREAEAARQTALANGQIGLGRQSNNNYAMSNLMSIWEKTGVAPEGIPGVKAGTPLYDKTGARQDDQLQNKQEKLDIKHFSTERDGMISSIRSGKVAVPDAMKQVNQDEQLGIYTPDLAEKLRAALRVLGGNQPIPGDTLKGPQIDLSGLQLGGGGGGGTSVTQSVFGR